MQYLKNNQVVIYNANVDTVKGLSVVTKSANIRKKEKNIKDSAASWQKIAVDRSTKRPWVADRLLESQGECLL